MASKTTPSKLGKRTWSELGSAAVDAGNLAEAERCFKEAIRADKRNGRHHFHLAVVLELQGKFASAAEHLTRALHLNPNDPDAARRLTSLISRRPIPADVALDPNGIKAALHHDASASWVITKLALHHLKSKGALGAAIAMGKRDGWQQAARALCLAKTADLLRDDLFLEILRTNILRDAEVEYLLTAVRLVLLLELPHERFQDRDLLKFTVAMMHQCCANEHVWHVTGEEEARLAGEPLSLTRMLDGDVAEGHRFLLRSLYREFRATLGEAADPIAVANVRPKALREAAQAHLAEENDLRARAKRMPTLGPLTDDVSRSVALQYEKNPYPRWTSLRKPAQGEERQRLATFFTAEQLAFMEQPYNVLIAGCGTGFQAVYAALDSANARVTAVDLSASALAYASRMAERYGAKNIDFLQGDVQLLPTRARFASTFQIIECVGVLHHMADPFRGWRALLDCLAPGGIMLVGLYSATARHAVTELKNDPAHPGTCCDDDALRNFRRDLMGRSDDERGGSLKLGPDFYSASEFRDLACHVNERCVTLSEIRAFLERNALAFRGFWMDRRELDQFHKAYPDEPWPGRLEFWEEFEARNPRTFAAMYHFWCTRL